MGSISRQEREHHGLLPPPFPITDQLKFHELRLGEHYAAANGGFLPVNQFWQYFTYRHDIDTTNFDHYHPAFASLLDRDEALRHERDLPCPPTGLLPQTPFWDYLRYRHDLNPKRFDFYHPWWAKALDKDEAYREMNPPCMMMPVTPVTPSVPEIPVVPPSIPEPPGIFLLGIGLTVLGFFTIIRRILRRRILTPRPEGAPCQCWPDCPTPHPHSVHRHAKK